MFCNVRAFMADDHIYDDIKDKNYDEGDYDDGDYENDGDDDDGDDNSAGKALCCIVMAVVADLSVT